MKKGWVSESEKAYGFVCVADKPGSSFSGQCQRELVRTWAPDTVLRRGPTTHSLVGRGPQMSQPRPQAPAALSRRRRIMM